MRGLLEVVICVSEEAEVVHNDCLQVIILFIIDADPAQVPVALIVRKHGSNYFSSVSDPLLENWSFTIKIFLMSIQVPRIVVYSENKSYGYCDVVKTYKMVFLLHGKLRACREQRTFELSLFYPWSKAG